MAAAPFVSLIVVPWAFARSRSAPDRCTGAAHPDRPPSSRPRCRARRPRASRRRRATSACAAAPGSRSPSPGSCWPSRRCSTRRSSRSPPRPPTARWPGSSSTCCSSPARPAAALPVGADLPAAPPRRSGGHGGARGLQPCHPHHAGRVLDLRRAGRAGAAGDRAAGDDDPVRAALSLRTPRAGRRRAGYGVASLRRDPESGGPGARAGDGGLRGVVGRRGDLRGVAGAAAGGRRAAARRAGLHGRGGRAAGGPARALYRSGGRRAGQRVPAAAAMSE